MFLPTTGYLVRLAALGVAIALLAGCGSFGGAPEGGVQTS